MFMDLTRYEAMDAQRFDPMRRTNIHSNPLARSSKKDMGQILRKLSQPELPPNGVVGGIWSDHELVLVPIEVSSQRASVVSASASTASASSSSSSASAVSTASSSSQSSSSTYFTTPTPTAENGLDNAPSSSGSRHVETFDRDDLIITRTIIRPATQSSMRGLGLFSRPSSPIPAPSRPSSPLFRPATPVFQALNCFRPTAFEREVDDIEAAQAERSKQAAATTQQVLQVIVTQTREQYEQDLAFKEAVQQVYPEAGRSRRTMTQ